MSLTLYHRVIAENESVYSASHSKVIKYVCLAIDYDDPHHYCLYTIYNRAAKQIKRMPVTAIYHQPDFMDGFSTLDIQRICSDYALAMEKGVRKALNEKLHSPKKDKKKNTKKNRTVNYRIESYCDCVIEI